MGLRGSDILYTNLVIATGMLGLVYVWFRRQAHAPQWALLGTSTIALSMVTLTTIRYGGYCDALTYLLVFCAWWTRAKLWLSSSLYYFAMLNHEAAVFLTPWLLVAQVLERGRSDSAAHPGDGPRPRAWFAAAAGIAGAVLAFALTRALLLRLNPGPEYTFHFYMDPLLKDPLYWYRQSSQHRVLGALAAFNLYWVLPVLAGIHLVWRRQFASAAVILLPILCALAALFVAFDVTRMLTLSFMGMLLGTEYLIRTDAFRARRLILLLSVANFFVPQVNVAQGTVDGMLRR